ncbi:hypothetical protein DPMN_087504 [Dreissena polymorpha]|uniref:Uncharacterized protein n=1 Tax=Dreissena polymorpha TaxID=45954 RepID=A0A9D4KT37_DREPO|nr:hypothetical protein DPMN_087504 [Dreissena polymorpha]
MTDPRIIILLFLAKVDGEDIVVESLERRLNELMKKGETEKHRRCYLCGSPKIRKRKCPDYRRRKEVQKMSTSTKPE